MSRSGEEGEEGTSPTAQRPSGERSRGRAFSQTHDRRSVGLSDADGVVVPGGAAEVRKQERPAVAGESGGLGRVEPGEVPLRLGARSHDHEPVLHVLPSAEPAALAGDVEEREASAVRQRDPVLAREGHGMDFHRRPADSAGIEDLLAVGGPRQPFDAPVAAGQIGLLARQIHDRRRRPDRPSGRGAPGTRSDRRAARTAGR